MIVVKDLVKIYGNRRVLDGVTFTVPKGKTLVIMGGSGCGKSTLLRHMVGLDKPDEGHILIDDQDIARLSGDQLEAARRKFGVLFQSGALFNSMTVGENVALPLREHTTLSEEVIRIMVRIKLELVGLTGFENLMPSQISGGMKKRVGLARAIAMDPQVLFYDEPGAGLDPVVLASIDQLIADMSKKLGVTSIVVTHEMDSAFRIADRMVMLYQGKVVVDGTPEEIRESPDPIVQQFINGSVEGPIPLRQSKDHYLKELFGEGFRADG